jgi:hypothetical protein
MTNPTAIACTVLVVFSLGHLPNRTTVCPDLNRLFTIGTLVSREKPVALAATGRRPLRLQRDTKRQSKHAASQFDGGVPDDHEPDGQGRPVPIP